MGSGERGWVTAPARYSFLFVQLLWQENVMREKLSSWSDRAPTAHARSKIGRSGNRRARLSPDHVALRQAIESLESRRLLSTVTVTGTGDTMAIDGVVTLREAISSINAGANFNPDVVGVGAYGTADTINFNIPGAGVQSIAVTGSPLPGIGKKVTINGYSQPGASVNTLTNADNAVLLIELNGASAGAGADGLTLGTGSGLSTIKGLVINRFGGNGIVVQTDANSIIGNFIGTDATGTARSPNGSFPNSGDGVRITSAFNNDIGGTTPADRNIVSGNSLTGVHIIGTTAAPAEGNNILGNFIGVGADGISPVGNRTEPAPAPGAPEGNNLFGVEISGGDLNIVGGTAAGARNVIGFNGDGIELDNGSQQNRVEGNFIGVGADGITPTPNLLHGVAMRSSNGFGPPLGPAQPNEPGTSNNMIGGTAAGAGNLVAFNGTGGIAIFGNPVSASGEPNVGNAILGNSVFLNGRSYLTASSAPLPLIGIDLTNGFTFPRDDGITPNDSQGHGDADDPNNFQNFPIITGVTPNGGMTDITGTLSAEPNATYRIELFANDADPLGLPAEGQQFIGFVNVFIGFSGTATFSTTVNVAVAPGRTVTATATDPSGNTSEFSVMPVTYTVTGTGDTIAVDGLVTLREAIASANQGSPINADVTAVPNFGTIDRIHFNIAGGGVKTISTTGALPIVTSHVVIDGYTQPGSSANTLANGDNAVRNIVLNGAGAGVAVNGLRITAGMSTVQGLAIGGFITKPGEPDAINAGGNGIVLTGNGGNTIAGNSIGTGNGVNSPNGRNGIVIQCSNNIVGGTDAAARNIVSGNGASGLLIQRTTGTNNRVQGNFIGTDVTGTSALGNAGGGVAINQAANNLIGGTTAGARNIISGNSFQGIGIFNGPGSGNLVQGNFIGTDVTGTAPLGNSTAGVQVISTASNVIGGSVAAANRIAFNGECGVLVSGNAVLAAIRFNSIYSNVGLGIDLLGVGAYPFVGDGVTPNDPDDGDSANESNHLQNFPVLTSAVSDGTNTKVTGVINTNANVALVIDFYANATADPSGFGEGQTYLGSAPVALNSLGNNASFSATFPGVLPAGQFISATATNVGNAPYGDTSEFSQAIEVTGPASPPASPPTIKVNDVTHTEGNSGTKDYTFTVTLSHSSSSTVTVHYVTQNGTASSGSDYVSKSGNLTFTPGQTSKTVTVKGNGDTTVEANETFFLKLTSPVNAGISDGSGLGTIQNDDPTKPKISVSGSSNTEGNSGTKAFTFKITLDQATTVPMSVHYATSNGTAIAGSDYNSASGTVTFAAGETVKTITVLVKGDLSHESDETFFVKLSSAINATIAVGTGKGTIRNDD
jgi:hypothetical protein